MVTRARSARSLQAEKDFRNRLAELGAELIDTEWLGNTAQHRVRCARGHDCSPTPKNINKGQGICRTCAGRPPRSAARQRSDRSLRAEQDFRESLAHLGAELIEATWLGSGARHQAICAQGHKCHPTPDNVKAGQGICRVCAGVDPDEAERKFRDWVEGLGGEFLEPVWRGRDRPHRVKCPKGHETTAHPGNRGRSRGMCSICAGNNTEAAERAFGKRVAALGGTVLETEWLGNGVPHRVKCAKGHIGRPRPASVQQGQGICRTCAGKDPQVPQRKFLDKIAEEGAVLLEPVWLGAAVPHLVRCVEGHESSPRPADVANKGTGICQECGYAQVSSVRRAAGAEAAFKGMQSAGFEPLDEYPGRHGRWRSRHLKCQRISVPTWGNVSAGHGCMYCAERGGGFKADAPAIVYVLHHQTLNAVKVGITAIGGNASGRL